MKPEFLKYTRETNRTEMEEIYATNSNQIWWVSNVSGTYM